MIAGHGAAARGDGEGDGDAADRISVCIAYDHRWRLVNRRARCPVQGRRREGGDAGGRVAARPRGIAAGDLQCDNSRESKLRGEFSQQLHEPQYRPCAARVKSGKPKAIEMPVSAFYGLVNARLSVLVPIVLRLV